MQIARSMFLIGFVALTACGAQEQNDEPITFEEFEALAYREPDTGIYVFNGDEIAEDRLQLRAAYEDYLVSHREAVLGFGRAEEGLAVNTVGGQDDIWNTTTRQNLTYCIRRSSFTTTQYNQVVAAMNTAVAAWEGVANVNYVHLSNLDANNSLCNNTNNGIVFNVRRVFAFAYLARAFFPSSSRSAREILIDITAFLNNEPWTLAGILRHELGHTLGFRHEHTRPEAGTCFEDNNWRGVTAYDSSSVMHYPQCNGTQTGDLVLTTLDGQGAGTLYP